MPQVIDIMKTLLDMWVHMQNYNCFVFSWDILIVFVQLMPPQVSSKVDIGLCWCRL